MPDISMKKYLVFDWGGTEIKYAVMNEEGEILDHNAVPSPLKEDTRDIFMSMLDDVVSLYKEDIDGIAISSPGIIDAEKGMIAGVSTFPYMNGFDVRTLEESKNKIKKIDSTEIDKINNNIKKYLEELEKQEINISDVIEKVEARLIEINMVIYILKKGKSEYKEKTYNELTKNPITAIIFCIKPLFRR